MSRSSSLARTPCRTRLSKELTRRASTETRSAEQSRFIQRLMVVALVSALGGKLPLASASLSQTHLMRLKYVVTIRGVTLPAQMMVSFIDFRSSSIV